MRSEISASDRGEKEFRHLVGSVIEGEWVGKVGSGNRLLMSATFSQRWRSCLLTGWRGVVKKGGEGREKFVRV